MLHGDNTEKRKWISFCWFGPRRLDMSQISDLIETWRTNCKVKRKSFRKTTLLQGVNVIILSNPLSPIAVVRHSWRCNFPKNTKYPRLSLGSRNQLSLVQCSARITQVTRCRSTELGQVWTQTASCVRWGAAAHIHTLQRPHADPIRIISTLSQIPSSFYLSHIKQKMNIKWNMIHEQHLNSTKKGSKWKHFRRIIDICICVDIFGKIGFLNLFLKIHI